MKKRFGTVVAAAVLHDEHSPRKKILISIGKPRSVEEGHWICPYQIRGLRPGRPREAHGFDAVQALIHAVESVRLALARSRRRLTCVGHEPGDTGFPRFVPTVFGPKSADRMGRLIDRELERAGRLEEKRYLRRRSTRTRRGADS
jgi:hypothetical protein